MRIAVAVLLALMSGACGGARRSPEAAVRALVDAARDQEAEEVYGLLGPRTRARLAVDARRGGEQAGRRVLRPSDLLSVGFTPPGFVLDDTHELERSRDHAIVEAVGRRGERERVELVKESDGWKVELP